MLSVENNCEFDEFRVSFHRGSKREVYFVQKAPITGCLKFLFFKRGYEDCVERTNVAKM